MTALVVLHHTAITYGAAGGWFWREMQPSGSVSSQLLVFFCSVNQAYFMGCFFLLAGYFTPGSLERKGYARFIGDRFTRLGLPLLAFICILGPLTASVVSAAEGHGFWSTFVWLWNHHVIINGPLWFAQALLIFTLLYCGWRALAAGPLSEGARIAKKIPGTFLWLASAVAVGAVALGIRQFVPAGVTIIGLQLGYFATYIFLFVIGVAAWRFDWLSQLGWKDARAAIAGAVIALPALPVSIAYLISNRQIETANFSGGLSWPAVLYAFWEPLVAWGMIAGWLLTFRSRMNGPARLWSWLNRRAYTVYILHPPILVGISLLLHPWGAPALVKFGVTGTLGCVICWLAADPFVRMPGIRRVI